MRTHRTHSRPVSLISSDIDGDSLDHVTIVDLPDTVNLTLNGNPVSSGDDIAAADIGNLVFTPAANATNTHMFSFTVNDGTADSATRYFTINITPVNDAPTAADNTITTNEDTAHTFRLVSSTLPMSMATVLTM